MPISVDERAIIMSAEDLFYNKMLSYEEHYYELKILLEHERFIPTIENMKLLRDNKGVEEQ